MTVFSGNAPYGEGGLGYFLASVVEEARVRGRLDHYFSTSPRPNDAKGYAVSPGGWATLFRLPPLRWRHAWRERLASAWFDRAVARRMTETDTFYGFGGACLYSLRRARSLGVRELVVESATSHIHHVRRRHRAATAAYPIEDSWLGAGLYRRTLREYELADTIVVTSEYSRESFLSRGVPASKLRRRVQQVARRFAAPPLWQGGHGFHVVYVGRLQLTKGIPVLIEAFRRIDVPGATLTLVGGSATAAMDQYLKQCLAADPRIRIAPGDPLPHLHRADVLVHPSYEDGLGLAPLEALACGVPVLVTCDTGMKEYVVGGQNGFVLPTGDVAALVEYLELIRRRPLRGTFEPFRVE